MNDSQPDFYRYWGKARKQEETQPGDAYHLLPYHCLDVAAMGAQLLSPTRPLTQDLASFLEITPQQLRNMVVFALALHDLGKFAAAFQRLYLSHDGQLRIPEGGDTYDSGRYRHDRLGLYFWDQLKTELYQQIENTTGLRVLENKAFNQSWMVLINCVLGHHGQPIEDMYISSMAVFTEPHNVQAAREWINELLQLLPLDLPIEHLCDKAWRKRFQQISWQLAGVAVLADWLGSNQTYFLYQKQPESLRSYWDKSQQNAVTALSRSGLASHLQIAPFQSVLHHFNFTPTPLQAWAEQVPVDDSPQLFILEDVTGSGKTEAALTLTHRLMAAGAADGFYFGLPTMATSNAMFHRVVDHYLHMFDPQGETPYIVLAHGARDMNDRFQLIKLNGGPEDRTYNHDDHTATAQCTQWLADSRKKALLAPVGVGTIDQVLMAILPRRHQSLRLLGLHRKILIFDEIHAADDYMFELLEGLLKLHFYQGGSVILLTATLPLKQRQRLIDIWRDAAALPRYLLQNTDFPLATCVTYDADPTETQVESRASVSRTVNVEFLHHESACFELIRQVVAQNQCVVWVRNSVKDALAAYQTLQGMLGDSEHCILFHSRFVLQDRQKIEHRVLDIYGKGDRERPHCRAGKVLISTQIFQESIDADADVMISDLCPIDDLIQRAGRLHRHVRDEQGNYIGEGIDERPQPILYVHSPEWDDEPAADWLSRQFRNTEYVYRSPGRLWLGQRILRELGGIQMPENARKLIEAVYGDDRYEQIPETLIRQENRLMGDECAKTNLAWSLKFDMRAGYCLKSSKYWHEDQSDIGTRYSDVETVDVLVLKLTEENTCVPWAGEGQFALPLSTVKVPKKDADALVPVEGAYAEAIYHTYRAAQFLRLWLPEQDQRFHYDMKTGFYEQTPQD